MNERSLFYSLMLLFVPFTDESNLVGKGQTAEEVFGKHFPDCASIESFGIMRFAKMPQALSKVKQLMKLGKTKRCQQMKMLQ